MNRLRSLGIALALALLSLAFEWKAIAAERIRVLIETDAGGDPDDEQSLVRFLLYSNEWDVEGIISNRPVARDRENRNPERTGLGIIQRLVKAYGECYPNLVRHDPRYPKPEVLLRRTVAGYDDSDDGVKLIIAAVDRDDPRPLWYSDWGSDRGSGTVNLKRVLDKVLAERGPKGYARFKDRLRLVSYDQFGEHTTKLTPPFRLWVNTFQPPLEGKRWYHRFSALTATAGGFDLNRDMLTGHGPLGALYPTNTTHPQKEGDTMTFLYLVPTGMNNPEQPIWGSWAGRYGRDENHADRPYYWANVADTWQDSTDRDNTLKRWAVHLQNDFKARLDWCVTDFARANHPPVARVRGRLARTAASGERVVLAARDSTDPDKHRLKFDWIVYPEPGSYRGPVPTIHDASSPGAWFIAPQVDSTQTLHIILTVTDEGSPPLTRYERVIVTVRPRAAGRGAYFPPPDAEGGWRTLKSAGEVQRVGGMDTKKLDEAFEFIKGSTKNGGLLVLRKGWLVYENYFGLGHRDATPNLASCGKSFTSIALGILLDERPKVFPDGLNQKVFTPAYLPLEAFPLSDPRKKDIKLGQLLAMTAGIRGNNPVYVLGEEHSIDPAGPDGSLSCIDAVAFGRQEGNYQGRPYSTSKLWCEPGGGYSYATSSIHLASVVLRHVTGMELQQYVEEHLAKPMGWGTWGYGYRNATDLKHTPGGGGIAVRATDMLRFGYLLQQEGRWENKQLVPAKYVRLCSRISPYNPHYPYSLQFDVNEDGRFKELPRDAYWKSGSGGHVLYVVPSLDLVVWKLGGRDEQYSTANTGLPPSPASKEQVTARRDWKETVDQGTALHKTLQMVIESTFDRRENTVQDKKEKTNHETHREERGKVFGVR